MIPEENGIIFDPPNNLLINMNLSSNFWLIIPGKKESTENLKFLLVFLEENRINFEPSVHILSSKENKSLIYNSNLAL